MSATTMKGTIMRPSEDRLAGLPNICRSAGDSGRLFRDLLDRVGDKWSMLIIGTLQEGPLRFTALEEAIGGISQRMLTLNLRHLERDGLITRTVYAEVPPRVEYELTDLGRTLLGLVMPLARWTADNSGRIQSNRDRFDSRAG
jgi:DNA-binding HxlR family transcriptional regulator